MSDWIERAKRLRRDQFSELDVLLRVLDRAFNPDNHPLSDRNYRGRDFSPELAAVRDVMLRLLSLLESLIPESRKNAYWFHKFAEQKFLTDRKRDLFRESLYKQDTEEKSIFLLYDSFVTLKVLILDLLKQEPVSYDAFRNFGELIVREIRENRYYDPFKKEFHPEFDRIDNSIVSGVVKSIKKREMKRSISILVIYLFRVLRYLSHIDITSHLPVAMNTAYLILVLVRSELREMLEFIETAQEGILKGDVRDVIGSVGFQVSMETKRVYEQELRDILSRTNQGLVKGRIENSYGILKNAAEQAILQIVQAFKPELRGEDIFPSFENRYEQSLRLLEDVTVLSLFFRLLEENFDNPRDREGLFASLRGYMLYFQSFTFKLLRYEDYEEFSKFFEDFLAIPPESAVSSTAEKILQKCRRFRIYLDTTLNLISQRAELKGRAVDAESLREIMVQFLPEGLEIDKYLKFED